MIIYSLHLLFLNGFDFSYLTVKFPSVKSSVVLSLLGCGCLCFMPGVSYFVDTKKLTFLHKLDNIKFIEVLFEILLKEKSVFIGQFGHISQSTTGVTIHPHKLLKR